MEALVKRLHTQFCRFQQEAKTVEDRVKATQTPLDTSQAEQMLAKYSCGVAEEMRRARDELRRGQWDIDKGLRADHDMVCFCLAVWELAQELVVSSAPSAPRLLHWYGRHYLEEDLAEWWQTASRWAEDPEGLKPDSELWEPLCRLALADCHSEVLELLQRSAEGADKHVARVCDFLRMFPSLRQMDQVGASAVDYGQAMREIKEAAQRLLREIPSEHPVRQLLRIFAGSPQSAFDANEDIAAEMGRTWVEDVVYAHAWVFPDLRKTELADLLRAVARRRTAETIDDFDSVLFAVLTLDVPELLRLLASLPDRFPPYFVTHLVDVLYYAGRIPTAFEVDGRESEPPRDFHLVAYAEELRGGPRQHHRFALDYLRAGGSPAARQRLELFADRYCAAASTEEEMEDGLAVLLDLGLGAELGVQQCRRRSEVLRKDGDVPGCLRWACRAEEECAPTPRGFYVSELLDTLSGDAEDLKSLIEALRPQEPLAEPLDRYPPESLLRLLGDGRAVAPSGRLFFFVQYARCLALRDAGQGPASYAPTLVRLLVSGAASPSIAQAVIEEDLMPALREDATALGSQDALLLMRHAQALASDPLRRAPDGGGRQELHKVLGTCLSRTILRGPGKCAA